SYGQTTDKIDPLTTTAEQIDAIHQEKNKIVCDKLLAKIKKAKTIEQVNALTERIDDLLDNGFPDDKKEELKNNFKAAQDARINEIDIDGVYDGATETELDAE